LACVDRDVVSRPPDPAFEYTAFVDPATGSGADAMALSIVHVRDGIAVPDTCVQTKPPFSAAAVVDEWGSLLRAYRITTVYGDNFAAGLVRELFQQRIGVNYISHGVPAKSQIYLTALTYVNSQQCRLFDISRLLDQALQLERSPGRDGHDSVDHTFGAHDDLINAYAGAVVMAMRRAAIDQPVPIFMPGYYVGGVEISAPNSFLLSQAAAVEQPPQPPPSGDAELARLGSRELPRKSVAERVEVERLKQTYINGIGSRGGVPGAVYGVQPLPEWWGK